MSAKVTGGKVWYIPEQSDLDSQSAVKYVFCSNAWLTFLLITYATMAFISVAVLDSSELNAELVLAACLSSATAIFGIALFIMLAIEKWGKLTLPDGIIFHLSSMNNLWRSILVLSLFCITAFLICGLIA